MNNTNLITQQLEWIITHQKDFPLHYKLDRDFQLNSFLILVEDGNLDAQVGPIQESPLHVAARRRRLQAIKILVQKGCPLDDQTRAGISAYAHAKRRGFNEVAEYLKESGAKTSLTLSDQLSVSLSNQDYQQAVNILESDPELVPSMDAEEARIFPDLAGRMESESINILINRGIDLGSRGLDGGTALHMAAWFGSLKNLQILINAGADLEDYGDVHKLTPLGWAAHGSRYSGGANQRQEVYLDIAKTLLDAGASVQNPTDETDTTGVYLQKMASDPVWNLIQSYSTFHQ